jgi:hypothetical protein
MFQKMQGIAPCIYFLVFVAFLGAAFFVSFFAVGFAVPQPFAPQVILSPPLKSMICKSGFFVNNIL